MSILSVKNISQSYGKKQILRKISFEAQLGEVVAFLGPNGAGKTTLLKSIIGFLPVSQNKHQSEENIIYFDNKRINRWSVSRRVENGLVYLPQQTSLFANLTVMENLKLVYQYHPFWKRKSKAATKDGKLNLNVGSRKKVFEEEMDNWLSKTSLFKSLSLKGYQLSGGQKRKLEVVRSLLMHPQVIMLDEPFAGVDPKSIYELKAILIDLAKKGICVVISDHNVDQLLSIANLIYVIIDGQVVVSGGIKEVMNNEYTQKMYLGKQFHSEMSEKFLW